MADIFTSNSTPLRDELIEDLDILQEELAKDKTMAADFNFTIDLTPLRNELMAELKALREEMGNENNKV